MGFGGKYLPSQATEASRMIGGKPIYDPLQGGMRTGIGSGTEISGATLKEFDANGNPPQIPINDYTIKGTI